MINVRIYRDISSENNDMMMFFGDTGEVFSSEKVKDIFESNPDEKDFRFDINCNGGSVSEGFAIYDIMRTSGKNIYCNIDGACHSMAIVLLLAAPKQNRTANPNATALIHDVMTYAGAVTAESAGLLAEDLKRERERILDVYAERTNLPKDKLESIMLEEKERSATELLEWGFINKINEYTNSKNMQKKEKTVNDFLLTLKNFFTNNKIVNYDFEDAEGNFLFSTDREDNTLEVGMPARPTGTFTLPDGRVVIIEDDENGESKIQSINNPTDAAINELKKQLADTQNRLGEALKLLSEADNHIKNLAAIKSNHKVQPRQNNLPTPKGQTNAERKDEIRKNLGKKTGGE